MSPIWYSVLDRYPHMDYLNLSSLLSARCYLNSAGQLGSLLLASFSSVSFFLSPSFSCFCLFVAQSQFVSWLFISSSTSSDLLLLFAQNSLPLRLRHCVMSHREVATCPLMNCINSSSNSSVFWLLCVMIHSPTQRSNQTSNFYVVKLIYPVKPDFLLGAISTIRSGASKSYSYRSYIAVDLLKC